MTHEYSDLMKRIDELWGGGDVAAADELYAQDLSVNGIPVGIEDVKAIIARMRTAFPDVRFELKDQFVAGDRVVTRMEQTGTHLGSWDSPIGTLEPTGRTFTISGIEIHRIADGKVAEA